jgi:phage baseplate assembly protein W
MPIERVSIGFKDISMSFLANPINRDLIDIKNETAVARSIRNLILTGRGERFFDEYLGSRVSKYLFENLDEFTAESLKTEIKDVIRNREPRVTLDDVIIDADFDNNSFNVSIFYRIIGLDALPQQLSFVLLATR